MKLSGWIFMILSWGFILGLGIFCFSRILQKGLDVDDIKKKPQKKERENS